MAQTLISGRRSSPAIYKTLRRLGKGGMAEVFLARQEGVAGFRRLAVVKRLLPQFSSISNVAEMLLDEARIAAQLNHPNIVQIYELGQEDDQYFIAMEYVDGCDLATLARIERRRKSRVPMRLALRVVSEAAMGLDYAHRHVGLDGRPLNLVHRDVSPHNVLCSREGAVKVTDFGIAKAVGKVQVTEVGVVKGKVHYMSPEQYTGGEVDKRSDVFSLGVVLYQLTTGRLPRVTKSGQVNMRQVTEGTIPRPSEIRADYPHELDDIVMRALMHNPDDRYQDCASLRDDLLDFAREHDLLAFPKDLGDYVSDLVPQPELSEEADEDSSGVRALSLHGVTSDEAPGTERVALVQPITSPGRRYTKDGTDLTGDESVNTDTEIPIEDDIPSGVRKATARTDSAVVSAEWSSSEVALPMGLEERLQARAPRDEPGTAASSEVSDHGTDGSEVDSRVTNVSRITARGRPGGREERARRDRRPSSRAGWSPDTGLDAGGRLRPARAAHRTGAAFAAWIAAILVVALAIAGLIYAVDRGGGTGPGPVAPSVAPGGMAQPGAGGIDVIATPAQAAVFIDGAQRCPRTPCGVSGLPLGRELLVTVRGGKAYNLWVQRVVLTTQQPRLLLQATLTPAEDTGEPSAALPAEAAPPADAPTRARAAGTPRRASRKAGSAAKSGGAASPKAKKPEKGKGKVSVAPVATDAAVVAVDVRPGWAEIWVDGQQVGHTPFQFSVPPGKHTVELKNAQHEFHKVYRIDAKKGTKTKITDKIEPKQQEQEGKPRGA